MVLFTFCFLNQSPRHITHSVQADPGYDQATVKALTEMVSSAPGAPGGLAWPRWLGGLMSSHSQGQPGAGASPDDHTVGLPGQAIHFFH